MLRPCCFWAPTSPGLGRPGWLHWAGRQRAGAAGPRAEQPLAWAAQASLPGSVGLTGWPWKNEKCLLRTSYEWPGHKPQRWTRAALLGLGQSPELSIVSGRLGGGPRKSCAGLKGQPALGKEHLGPGRAPLPRKDSRPLRKVCGTPFVVLSFKAGSVTEEKLHQSQG